MYCASFYFKSIKNEIFRLIVCNDFNSVFFPFSMSQLMQHHGCRSHLRDRNKLTGLEERFDMVVDSNDVILEKVVQAPVHLLLIF